MKLLTEPVTCTRHGDLQNGANAPDSIPRRSVSPAQRSAAIRRIAALGIVAALSGAWNLALSKTPRLPEQHVYPTSTLAEIQQALDTGGTVYFHYGDYYQIASSTPDLPPTPANPAKGFNVGKYGKDVDIIGLPGPGGDLPRIHGGNIAFRVGKFPGFGFAGLPLSFRIENLELLNPDLAGPGALFSRVGIWVLDVLGMQSEIDNCRITITGRETDPGKDANHSVAIWFRLLGTEPPPKGARIDITNNKIKIEKASMGIGLGHFWSETPECTAPRFLVSNNVIDVAGLRGYGTPDAAILLHGNLSSSALTNNKIRGDARLPGYSTLDSAIAHSRQSEMTSSNITIAGNDSSGFIGDLQLYLARIVSETMVGGNAFGSAEEAGILCYGHDNRFEHNHFYGAYPGWDPVGSQPGLFWFANTDVSASYGNNVVATKLNGPPYGFDICNQAFDETDDPTTDRYDGANSVPGYEKCRKKPAGFIERMLERKIRIEARRDEEYSPVPPPD